jgi:formylmethanofuran--tetrahydromethanopterin N-formyltransferase
MSRNETERKSTENENELELIKDDKDANEFVVKHRQTGNICTIEDTFAEMFPMWVGRVLITAATKRWAMTSASAATGFAVSIIMSPAEAGIEKIIPPIKTPDGRPGAIIQIYHTFGYGLKAQMLTRIGQCVMTCPTAAAYNAMTEGHYKLLKIGGSLSLFGDGFQQRDIIGGRRVWRIPVMEGDFIIEDKFGVKKGVAGGNFLILAKDANSGLESAEAAARAIRAVNKAVLTFPGGVCRSGSKVGSIKYKLPASTNHPFCPTLRDVVDDSAIPEGVTSVFELVINGLDLEAVKKAVSEGIKAAVQVPGVMKITAANYGGKLGPYKAVLKEVLDLKYSYVLCYDESSFQV